MWIVDFFSDCEMASTERWVNDRLHDILGISDKLIGQYLIGLAKQSTSASNFVEKLRDTGTVDVDANMTQFASELWEKVGIILVVE